MQNKSKHQTLLVLPPTFSDPAALKSHLPALDALFPEGYDTFVQAADADVELKKTLMGAHYGTIVVAFVSSPYAGLATVQAARSLAVGSRVVLYCPDQQFVRARGNGGHAANSEAAKWYEEGRRLEMNLFRQADLVVVESIDETSALAAAGIFARSREDVRRQGLSFRERKATVSIVILTFNQLSDTVRCIESLDRYTATDHELIFVDNGSSDGTRKYLADLAASRPNVRCIFNETNLGFAKANNQGMRIARGEYILLLNNDVVLSEHWLERLLACLESDPLVGIVGPCTNHAAGQQVLNVELPLDNTEIQRFACAQALANAGYWYDTHRIIGFCLLARREVIERVGMLDERFGPGGFEDYDFCLRVRQGGYRIRIAFDVFVYHIGGQGYSNNNLDYDKLRQKNVQIFIDKWCKRALEIMETLPRGMTGA